MTRINQNTSPPSLRQAAILVAALERRSADALLDAMSDEAAAHVRAAIMDLDDVSELEQEAVIAQFMQSETFPHSLPSAGIELDQIVEQPLAQVPTSSEIVQPEPPPFQFLHEATTDGLAKHLQSEHPQIIAVVVAHLSPRRGADLIKRFPEKLQVDVLRRVAELDSTPPEILQDLENHLEGLLSDEIRAHRNRAAGVQAVASILDAAGADRADLVNVVSRNDTQLMNLLTDKGERPPRTNPMGTPPQADRHTTSAQDDQAHPPSARKPASNQRRKPRSATKRTSQRARQASPPRPANSSRASDSPPEPLQDEGIEFQDLASLDDRALATVFQTADDKIVVLALSGTDEALVHRILGLFPSGRSRNLQHLMKNLSPIQLADVERAQRSIARLATRMASRNVISLPQTRRFAVAA